MSVIFVNMLLFGVLRRFTMRFGVPVPNGSNGKSIATMHTKEDRHGF